MSRSLVDFAAESDRSARPGGRRATAQATPGAVGRPANATSGISSRPRPFVTAPAPAGAPNGRPPTAQPRSFAETFAAPPPASVLAGRGGGVYGYGSEGPGGLSGNNEASTGERPAYVRKTAPAAAAPLSTAPPPAKRPGPGYARDVRAPLSTAPPAAKVSGRAAGAAAATPFAAPLPEGYGMVPPRYDPALGRIERDAVSGSPRVRLNDAGRAAHGRMMENVRKRYGQFPGAGEPGLPQPDFKAGLPNYNPWTGEYSGEDDADMMGA